MLHALHQKCILLANDFGCDLEDRARALVERARQPGRGLHAFGQERLFLVRDRPLGDARIIGLVHQHLRQRVGVEFDIPAAVGGRAHIDVGHDRLHHAAAEHEARLRIEAAQFRDHVGEVFLVHVADTAQRRVVALRQQIEIADQRLHRRIEAVALAQLDGQALRKIARANAGRIEGLQFAQHGFDFGLRRAELLRHFREIGTQIAALVYRIDQMLPDQAMHRIHDRERELPRQMFVQRDFRGNEGFEIIVVVGTAAGTDARPFGISRRFLLRGRRFGRRRGGVVGKYVFEIGAELFFHRGTALEAVLHPVVAATILAAFSLGGKFRLHFGQRLVVALAFRFFRAFQQRIAFQFGFDKRNEIEIGQLQQLDRLHQLRRHHEPLARPHFEFLRDCHCARPG